MLACICGGVVEMIVMCMTFIFGIIGVLCKDCTIKFKRK